jgi:Fe2+ or Zn2+ uptake regulation protein
MIFNYLSGLKEDSCELSVNEVLDFALKTAGRCVKGKRLEMLRIIAETGKDKTITSVVDDISRNLCCPKSTVWMNVNFLKDLGLIENGRFKPVKVTAMGIILLERNNGEVKDV